MQIVLTMGDAVRQRLKAYVRKHVLVPVDGIDLGGTTGAA